ALVFAPAIAGTTVALATGMNGVDTPGSAIDVAALGQVIGVYVLVLAVILPVLSVALERGYAPIRMGYRAGIALAIGSVLYPMTFLAARTLVYV
ncbi:MAG: type II secretion system protein, partial [Halanaeroarchaeum sp.]